MFYLVSLPTRSLLWIDWLTASIAALHIVVHNFKSPLAIVLPRAAGPEADELLRRKERMLQRRRLGKRLVWDIVAWALVIIFGVGGVVAIIARVTGLL